MKRTGYVKFADIKRRVSIEQVLRHYGLFDRLSGEGPQRKGPNPFIHGSASSGKPLAINLEKNVWTLFGRDGQADSGGNVLDFVMRKEGCDVRRAAQQLEEWFGAAELIKPLQSIATAGASHPGAAAKQCDGVDEQIRRNKPLGFELKGLDPDHDALAPLLEKWSLGRDVVRAHGAGLYAGKGKAMKGRLAVPIDHFGVNTGYCGIAVDEEGEPLYKFPDGWIAGIDLYNLSGVWNTVKEALKRREDIELLVFRDILQVWQAEQLGHRAATAIMGDALTAEHIALLGSCGLLENVPISLQLHIEGSIL